MMDEQARPDASVETGAGGAAAPGSDPVRRADLERVLEIPLMIRVQLGKRRMRIREILEVGAGSVLELDTASGAPLSVFANETLIARGEAVVTGDRYGIRVTDIVTPAARAALLGGMGEGL